MEVEGIDEVFQRCRFNPSPMDAVTYYLPRLISGEPMPHGVERLIHRADVYACEPKDLAAGFAPVPQSVPSDDRFFFTPCKRLKGSGKKSVRTAGAGTWVSQSTKDIEDGGVKVGEIKKLCFQLKGKVKTGWLMEEYRCCLQEAVAADGDLVMCKIYLSPNAGAAARQESAAYLRRQEAAAPVPAPTPLPEPVSAHDARKRPAPVAADPPCPKRTRVSFLPTAPPVVQQGYSAAAVFSALPPAAPALTEAPAAAEEADDGDMGRFTCTFDELFGVCGATTEEKEESENEVDEFASSLEGILGGEEEEEEQEGARTLPADDDKKAEEADDQQAVFAFDPILNLADIPSFTLDDLDMPPADHGEQPEQQAVFTSDEESAMAAEEEFKEVLWRYKRVESRPMFTLDQLDGHNQFFSYAG